MIPLSSTISKLEELQQQHRADFYYVGGVVRDVIRGVRPKDVDVVALGIKDDDLYRLLRESGEVQFVGRFGIYLFRSRGIDDFIQISLPRREVSTGPGHRDFDIEIINPKEGSAKEILLADSRRRDFTINAMYLPVGFNRDLPEVIDFQRGLQDISRGVLRFVDDPYKRISEDPIRIMRAFSLSARTGFYIHKSAKEAIANLSELLEERPAETVRIELEKILLSEKPSKILKLMLKLGTLSVVMPELADCAGISQAKKYHKYDVFTHCVCACDNAPQDIVLRLAALLHDIGKPETRELKQGHYTFYNHEIASVDAAYDILKRLRFSGYIIEEVLFLIRNHMYHYSRAWTDKAVRRFIKQVGISESEMEDLSNFPLFILRKADRLGSGFKTIAVTQRQKDFEDRIKDVYAKSTAFGIGDLVIGGRDLIESFKLEPSPIIGKVLRRLLDMVMEYPSLNKKDKLLEASRDLLSSKEHIERDNING